MNFEPLRTFQLSAEHTMRLTQALAPVLAEWGTGISISTPGSTVLLCSQGNSCSIPTAGEVTSCKHPSACAAKRNSQHWDLKV